MVTPVLILASTSPRRRQILTLGGWPFSVQPADIDEQPLPGETPRDYVLRLAEAKALTAARRAPASSPEWAVIASDTTVVDGETILGKPAGDADAIRMLTALRGRVHQVLTGVAVLRRSDGLLLKEVCLTDVRMRPYTDAEIRDYVASGDPLDKAGAYAIQHPAFHPVESLQGCYPSVMGLPLCRVTHLLAELGIPPASNVTRSCLPGPGSAFPENPAAPCLVFRLVTEERPQA
ncbi:MAG TPA: Maf family protein [Anaerolineaceae bacterium]